MRYAHQSRISQSRMSVADLGAHDPQHDHSLRKSIIQLPDYVPRRLNIGIVTIDHIE